ncbi:MAG: PAS domain S-box protein [Dehalococcoidia bacterium]
MNVVVAAAQESTGARLVCALREAGWQATAARSEPGPVDPATECVVADGFGEGQLPRVLATLIGSYGSDVHVLAGVPPAADGNALATIGIDDAYAQGDATDLVLRLRLFEGRRARSQAKDAASTRIEQANDVIYTVDFNGTFTSVNAASERLTGYRREELLGMSMTELVLPEYLELARSEIAAKLNGKTDSSFFEVQIRHADGSPRWVEISSRLIYENGRPVSVQGIARDTSARREMESRLRFHAELLDSISTAAFALDTEGRLAYWNSAASETFGRTAEEAMGANGIALFVPEARQEEATEYLRSAILGNPIEVDIPLLNSSGQEFPAHVSASALRNDAGEVVAAVALCFDLTDLHNSEERYRAAAELSTDAFFILEAIRDAEGAIADFRMVDMNSAGERLVGMPRARALGQPVREAFPVAWETGAFAGFVDVVETGAPIDQEVSFQAADGRVLWLHRSIVKLNDGVAVTSRDISAQKVHQMELDEARAQFQAIFESTSDGVFVLDRDLRMVTVNRAGYAAAVAVFGLAPQRGDHARPWIADSNWEDFQNNCARAFAGEALSVTWPIETKDGSQRWFEFTFAPVKQANGETAAIAMTARDITDSLRMKIELEEREAALAGVFASMNESLILMDRDMRFIMANPLAIERTKAFTGKTPIAGGSMEDYVQPQHWDGLQQIHARVLTGRHITRELQLRSLADGSLTWWEYSYHPVQGRDTDDVTAVAMVARDITDRKRAEVALSAATAHHRAVIDNTSDAIFALNVEGPPSAYQFRIAMVNKSFEALTGFTAARIVGKLVTEVLPPSELPHAIGRYHEAIRAGRSITYEEVVPTDPPAHIQTTMAPVFDEAGNCHQVIGSSRDITERVMFEQRERLLRERAEHLALIVESANDAILSIGIDRKLVSWSPGAERVYGWTAEEAIGADISLIYVPGESANMATDRLDQVFEGATFVDSPTQRRHKDGHTLDVLISAFPLRNETGEIIGVGSTATDVSGQRQAEAALREKAADLDAIFSNSKDQLVLLDHSGRIVAANPEARIVWHAASGQAHFEGLFRDWVPEDTREDFDQKFQRALAGESVNFERHITVLPEPTWFDVSYNPVRMEDGSVRGVMITSRNISERKRSTEALLQAQKLESLAVLAGGIAHDFNNLLVGILGNAGIALSELPATSPARPTVEAIELAGQRAAELARQMLAYSGKGKFLIQEVDINSLVEEMTHLLRVSIGKSVELRLHLAQDLPAVKIDATQIRQVAMNLVVNASDAIGEREGVISISTAMVEATPELLANTYLAPEMPAGKYISLDVQDTGAGMEPETLARIFDPFFTTKFTGRGLGLAAVLGIVRGHNGAIHVESEPGVGTIFRLLLPATSGEAAQQTPAAKPAQWKGEGTILVVDDEPTVRTVTARALKVFGFTVLEAADGVEGLDLFREHQGEIACVLLDMTMPRMNGEDTFMAIKELAPDARIILMSGYTEQDATDRFSGRGLSGFIQKPYELSALKTALQRAMEGDAAT